MLARWFFALAALCFITGLSAQEPLPKQTGANWNQASRFSSEFVRQFTYDNSVFPQWIGKTDNFWYQFRDSKGTHYWKVDPKAKLKVPLFDHAKLAWAISQDTQKPIDVQSLSLTRVTLNDEGTKVKFVLGDTQYEWDNLEHKLSKLGRAAALPPTLPPGIGGGQQLTEEQRRELMERFQQRNQEQQQQQQDQQQQQQNQNQNQQQQNQTQTQTTQTQQTQTQQTQTTQGQGQGRPGFGPGGFNRDYKAFSPDRKVYIYAYKHNLYIANDGKENEAVQITKDGEEDYSFGGTNEDRKARPNVSWSEDSKHFYIIRSDTRGMGELFLVNALTQPRPTLEKYKYGMPGEDKVRKQQFYIYTRETKKLARLPQKWKDESYNSTAWSKTPDELRFIRYDRLRRNLEVTSLNVKSNDSKVLISEGFESAYLEYQPIRSVEDTEEMIWWSERSGWAHLYLYDKAGKFKNAITAGNFRVSRISAVDSKNRVVYFVANGREEGENVYYTHTYSIRFDGTGLTLLDPGAANHNSILSPNRQYLVDNTSRVDQAPTSVLRDATGNLVMELEKADLTRLMQTGWKLPETFTVKAADGVTELYGNMWKPFDFDPKKKYPVIANVYPGPQTEGVTHTFAAYSSTMQMAQLGFIVIQVGHRGGTPQRSKAYASYGYFNMRDYALADKKYAIEQLGLRHPYIDVERVGIYGHSGGGFFSAAAMLMPPYNDFFKAAVASAGNHDNNIYNDSWAERYHGLKEVPADKKDDKAGTTNSNINNSNQNQNNQNQNQNLQQRRRGVGNRNSSDGEFEWENDDTNNGEDQWDWDFDTAPLQEAAKKAEQTKDDAKKAETKTEVKKDESKKAESKTEVKKDETKKDATKTDVKKDEGKKEEMKKDDVKKDEVKKDEVKKDEVKKDDTKKEETKTEVKKDEVKKDEVKKEEAKKETKFEIKIPTNTELAGNLKGHLLLVHGDMDNNVHPAGTMRLVDALIKANKRFEMLILPGKRHGFADAQPYFNQRMWEFFSEHLLEDRQSGADILQKKAKGQK